MLCSCTHMARMDVKGLNAVSSDCTVVVGGCRLWLVPSRAGTTSSSTLRCVDFTPDRTNNIQSLLSVVNTKIKLQQIRGKLNVAGITWPKPQGEVVTGYFSLQPRYCRQTDLSSLHRQSLEQSHISLQHRRSWFSGSVLRLFSSGAPILT